jgi:hypothetical protein
MLPATPPADAAPQPPRFLDLVRQLARDHFGQDGPADLIPNCFRHGLTEGRTTEMMQWSLAKGDTR